VSDQEGGAGAPEPGSAKAKREIARAAMAGARLAAVQALYQLEHTGQGVKAVVRDFLDDRLGLGPEGEPLEEADPDLFKLIAEGVVSRQAEIDGVLARHLARGWRLDRLDATARAIARAGAFELLARWDQTPASIISAYLQVADAFFEGTEPKFLNGLLDAVARDVRAD
jgi:N utilization substance protein B